MVARPWSSSRLSCGERPLLSCYGKSGISFPTTQGMDPSSRARRRKRGSSGCGRDSRVSSRVKTGMSGNFLSCSKGVKYPLEVPEFRCDYSRDAAEKMGLISTGAGNLLDFLKLRQELSTYDRDLRDSVADVSRFPSRGSRDLWLSLQAFSQGCPTCHHGVSGSSA